MMDSPTMSRAYLAAALLLFAVAACGEPASGPAPEKQPAAPVQDSVPASRLARGVVVLSGGAPTFRECGSPDGAAVTMTDPGNDFAKAFAALEAGPAEGIYVELGGTPGPLLRARSLREGHPCDSPVFEGEFVAGGNEPFWTIEIREKGIVFRSPEHPDGRVYPYALTRTASGGVVYATRTDEPAVSTLEIALEPARCVDSMSGELRSFKARVTLDGQALSGCAFAGVPHGEFGDAPLDELNRFKGAYPDAVRLWDDPIVHERLEALLGPALKQFRANMGVQSPLMSDSDVFYATGNKPHRGGLDGAIFLADPATDTIAVILYVNGTRQDFREGGRDIALPAEVVKTIGNVNTP
jgi:putative lipoprotein